MVRILCFLFGRYESQIIKGIVRHISKKLISHPELLTIDDHLVGINSRLEEMSSLLCMESNDVRIIGIYGIAGIGKTTLAKGIYNQIAHQFEDASFLPHVAEAVERHGLLELQRQLLADILRENFVHISNIHEGISLIKKTLFSRKVLIILDDVSALTQLELLAGSHQWFGSGSRIIITTRDKHLLDGYGVDGLYEVQKLKVEEALQLFSLNVFKADFPDEGFWELSGHALNYCDGLPAALKVLGLFLRGKTELAWENALLKQQTVGDRRIQQMLRVSFDGLDSTEKDLFLDIACFFRGKDSDSVGRILDSCNFSANGMKVLKDRSLISILDNKIEMHDLMQKMGWEIIEEEFPGRPGKWSRLWNPEDVHAVLTQNTVRAKCLNLFKLLRHLISLKEVAYVYDFKHFVLHLSPVVGFRGQRQSKEYPLMCWHQKKYRLRLKLLKK